MTVLTHAESPKTGNSKVGRESRPITHETTERREALTTKENEHERNWKPERPYPDRRRGRK